MLLFNDTKFTYVYEEMMKLAEPIGINFLAVDTS